MSKINNTQRAAFAKLLIEARDRITNERVPHESITKWTDFAMLAPESPTGKAAAKYKLAELKAAVTTAEEEFARAYSAADAEMDSVNSERRREHEEKLRLVTLAIRDVWAAEEIDTAKSIVESYVKQ